MIPKTREITGRRCGNAPRSLGDIPLMYACEMGHLETFHAFIPYLKEIEIVH